MRFGRRVVGHVVGGIAIDVDGDYVLGDEYSDLLLHSDEPADIHLRLHACRGEPPLRPAGAAVVEQDSWAAFLEGDTVQLCVKDSSCTPPEMTRIELSRNGLEGRYVYGIGKPYFILHPMSQLLVVHALGVAGGALMHAAGICGRDGALLVSGPSGTGKTTMSRACAELGAPILSDERTIVRPAPAGGWLLGGTPWPGEGGFADNRSVPLREVMILEQSDRDEAVPLSPARALALLYRCHFPPLWDPVAAERTLGHLEALVREVPAILYRNRKGPEAARLLLSRVGGAP